MNINLFFLGIAGGLSIIFFLFQPIHLEKKTTGKVPMLELENFKLSELNKKGLNSIMTGEKGKKYANRYVVIFADYTDNEGEQISNIKSDIALYKKERLKLEGNVEYIREDGLTFSTQKANYNQKTNIMTTPVPYTSTMNDNTVVGSYLNYDSINGITKSKNVTMNYKLKER